MSEFFEGDADGECFAAVDVASTYFCLSCGGHDVLEDGGDGEEWTVEEMRVGRIVGVAEKHEAADTASCVCFR